MLSCMLCVNKKLLKCKTRTTIVCAENMRKTKAYSLLIYHKYLKDTPFILWTLILLNFNSLTFCNSQIEAMDALNNIYMDLIHFFWGGGT